MGDNSAGKRSFRSLRMRMERATGSLSSTDWRRRFLAEMKIESQLQDEIFKTSSWATCDDEVHYTITMPESIASHAFSLAQKLSSHRDFQHITFDNYFDGITLLYTPSNHEFDICAVHGLDSNAADAFTGDHKLWLRDVLPTRTSFRKARTMLFGYDSRLFESANVAYMTDWVDSLLDAVQQFRACDNDKEKPLLFVCHSMGGLVVRKAMERLYYLDGSDEASSNIKLDKCAVLFLSTPHLGTIQADHGDAFGQFFSSVTGLRKDAILRELQSFNTSARESQEIWRLMAERRKRPPFACFCEARKTQIGLKARHIVTPVSAGFLDQAATQLPNTDHYQVCKFDDPFSQAFRMVQAKLLILSNKVVCHDSTIEQSPSLLPGQVRPTAHRYPLSSDQLWYCGGSLKPQVGKFKCHDETLRQLTSHVDRSLSSEAGEIISLTGMGGMGKTELLLEFGRRAHQKRHVFFCQATSDEDVASCLYRLAAIVGAETLSIRDDIQLADRESLWIQFTREQRIEAFIAWLRGANLGTTLVLFDDVDALRHPRDYEELVRILKWWSCTVLLTTRDPHLSRELADGMTKVNQQITVDALQEVDLVKVMRGFVTAGFAFSDDDLARIAKPMDGHVMAACWAVQYISQEMSLIHSQNVIDRFTKAFEVDSTDHQLRERFFQFQPRIGRSLADCFRASIDRLKTEADTASRLLGFAVHLCGPGLDFRQFMQHERPWLDLIVACGGNLQDIAIFKTRDVDFAKALRSLKATSALTFTGDGTPAVHTLMQDYRLQRQGVYGRLRIMRQILLLAHVSIQLNDNKAKFLAFVKHCNLIIHKFGIEVNEPQILVEAADIADAVKHSKSSNDLLTLRIRCDEVEAALASLSNSVLASKRDQIQSEISKLVATFKEYLSNYKEQSATARGNTSADTHGLLVHTCKSLIKITRRGNPIPLEQLTRDLEFLKAETNLQQFPSS